MSASGDEDPIKLRHVLLIHQNNLTNLRQQATEAGRSVPRYVSEGMDFELDRIREIQSRLSAALPPLQIRLRRLPEPGEPDGEERVFARLPVLMGRSSTCDWCLDNSQISQFHSWLVQDGNTVKMEDLGSTNGGAIIRDGSLVHRFQPRIGGDQFKVETYQIQERDLLYVATTRLVVEEIGPHLG